MEIDGSRLPRKYENDSERYGTAPASSVTPTDSRRQKMSGAFSRSSSSAPSMRANECSPRTACAGSTPSKLRSMSKRCLSRNAIVSGPNSVPFVAEAELDAEAGRPPALDVLHGPLDEIEGEQRLAAREDDVHARACRFEHTIGRRLQHGPRHARAGLGVLVAGTRHRRLHSPVRASVSMRSGASLDRGLLRSSRLPPRFPAQASRQQGLPPPHGLPPRALSAVSNVALGVVAASVTCCHRRRRGSRCRTGAGMRVFAAVMLLVASPSAIVRVRDVLPRRVTSASSAYPTPFLVSVRCPRRPLSTGGRGAP